MNTQTKPWGAGDLFLLIVLTAFCGFLFITMIPELCAVSCFPVTIRKKETAQSSGIIVINKKPQKAVNTIRSEERRVGKECRL